MDAQRKPGSDEAAGERDGRTPTDAGAETASDVPSAAVAVVVPAHNEGSRIALTVLAARQLRGVDLVVVVDAGSTDSTARIAEESGAVVIRLGAKVGRTSALLRGVREVADADPAGAAPRHLLLLDADLQQSAAEAVRLLEPVLAGRADLVLAGAEEGVVPARGAIARATDFATTRPLAAELCLTREAFTAAEPLSEGAGAGPGLIIDLLRKGFRVLETPVPWDHRPSRRGFRARLREARRRREVRRALAAR
jgi:glycosyltransferase involved in cell wall biosynthesis